MACWMLRWLPTSRVVSLCNPSPWVGWDLSLAPSQWSTANELGDHFHGCAVLYEALMEQIERHAQAGLGEGSCLMCGPGRGHVLGTSGPLVADSSSGYKQGIEFCKQLEKDQEIQKGHWRPAPGLQPARPWAEDAPLCPDSWPWKQWDDKYVVF